MATPVEKTNALDISFSSSSAALTMLDIYIETFICYGSFYELFLFFYIMYFCINFMHSLYV